MFVPDIRTVHVKDLNFILRSKVFVHWDGQLRAPHLILGVEPVYSTWQSFKQELLVDSPLLSYIDVRYVNFLPPKRYTCSDELAPLRDKSAERVSRCLRELAHEAIQQEAPIQEQAQPKNPVVEPEHPALETTILSAADTHPNENMMAKKVMTIDCFVPGAQQPTQPPPSQGRSQVPPPPPSSQAGRARKKQRVADQSSTGPGDAAVQTPPRPTGGIVIHELQTQVGPGVASSSQAAPAWKPKFLLDGKPLPSTACVRMWEKGEVVALPRPWPRVFFFPTKCMLSRKGRRSPWGVG